MKCQNVPSTECQHTNPFKRSIIKSRIFGKKNQLPTWTKIRRTKNSSSKIFATYPNLSQYSSYFCTNIWDKKLPGKHFSQTKSSPELIFVNFV